MQTSTPELTMWKRLPFKGYFYISVFLDLITILGIVILKGFLPPVVPLLYGSPAGNGQLVSTFSLLIAPGISLVITVINTLLSLTFKNEFLKKVLMISTLLISILTTVTVIKIFFLVGYF